MEETVNPRPDESHELVRTLLDVAPGDTFEFMKVQPNGTRKGYRVRVQLLRVDEDHQVLEDAQRYAKERKEAPREYGDLYKEGQAVALLTKALRKTEKHTRADGTQYYPPLFTDERQLRQSMTSPEMAQCLNFYEVVRSKYGVIEAFEEEAFENWVKRLSDPLHGGFFLSLLDSTHWANLILKLAQEHIRLRHLIWPDSTEHDPKSSTPDTGSFGELPEGSLVSSGEAFPTDHLIDKQEAASIAKRIYGKGE